MILQQTIAHYRITAKLGEGGMGEVWRATDTKLNRDVAIKILPESFAADPDRMARFAREAHVLASLNHPNIAVIHGVEERALILELVEGPTLTERIASGPIPLDEALPIARQIAEALEWAHERGVIHRDLKPANVKITPEGRVKVLDFGLARAAGQESSATDGSTTISMTMTEPGMIVGTAQYMSPEQARGKPVDRRTDIWAFGVVLWEMLAGRPLFARGDTVEVIASVVTREPDWDALPVGTPAHIRKLLERCLRKDVRMRLRDIGDARIAIEEGGEDLPPAVPETRRRAWLGWAAALAVVAGGIGWWLGTRPREPGPLVRMNVEIGPDMTLVSTLRGGTVALSPDGMRLVVVLRGSDGKIRLYTRLLNQNQLTALAGTEDAATPFFSPDGQWIGFAANGKVKKIAAEGGAAVTICDARTFRGASWGEDGSMVLSLNVAANLSRVSQEGGTPTPLTKLNPGERTHRWPQVLPGGHAVLFTAHNLTNNFEDASIDVILLKTGERRTVQHGGFSGSYLALPNGTGRLIYARRGALFAVPFDLSRLSVTGSPVTVLDDISSSVSAGGDFAFARTGTFVYLAGKEHRGEWTVSWVDRSGKGQPLEAKPGGYFTPRFSPDGKRLAYIIDLGQGTDVWVRDLERDTESRLSFLGGRSAWPVWTPDGKSIIFKSTDPAAPGMYWIPSNGAGAAQRLSDGTQDEVPYSISPDGKRLAYAATGNGGSLDLFTAPIEGDLTHPKLGKPELFLGTPFLETHPAFSPDGRWIAYMSQESGTGEIYVRPFPGPGGRWQISTGGGDHPVWSRGGHELLFRSADERVMVVSYAAQSGFFSAGKPSLWSNQLVSVNDVFFTWDLTPDGKRLAAVLDTTAGQKPPTLTFLLNFFDELERRGGGK